LLSLCRPAERGGANLKPRRSGADEFYGVKEFRAGDNPRWIHWKRTARTGALVAKEMVQIAPPRIVVLVDTYLESPAWAERVAVEKAIAMAGSLARQALDSGMAVGFCAWTGQWQVMAPRRGKRHCRDILAALAGLPENRLHPVSELMQRGEGLLAERVTPVLFTPRRFQAALGDRQRQTVVIPVHSPQAQAWFHFESTVDFASCMPADQAGHIQPELITPAWS
jgi:uncharacterized protein (DUF58 family)